VNGLQKLNERRKRTLLFEEEDRKKKGRKSPETGFARRFGIVGKQEKSPGGGRIPEEEYQDGLSRTREKKWEAWRKLHSEENRERIHLVRKDSSRLHLLRRKKKRGSSQKKGGVSLLDRGLAGREEYP